MRIELIHMKKFVGKLLRWKSAEMIYLCRLYGRLVVVVQLKIQGEVDCKRYRQLLCANYWRLGVFKMMPGEWFFIHAGWECLWKRCSHLMIQLSVQSELSRSTVVVCRTSHQPIGHKLICVSEPGICTWPTPYDWEGYEK